MYAILLVDDEPGHLMGLSKLLRRLRPDCSLHTAKNGLEALALCEREHFHLIITDIQMPIMDGLHFIEQLPERSEPRRIIYLTGYNYFEYAQKAIGLGTFEYVLKPIDVDKFMTVLERAEKSLGEERERLAEQMKMAAKLEAVVPVYRNRILTDWIRGNPQSQEANAELEGLTAAIEEGHLLVLKWYESADRKEWEAELLRSRVKQWLIEDAGCLDEGSFVFAPDHDRRIIVVIWKQEPIDMHLEAIARFVSNLHPDSEVRLGLSSRSIQILADAPVLYGEALTACEEGFYAEERSVYRYEAGTMRESHPISVDSRDESILTDALNKEVGEIGLASAVEAVVGRHIAKKPYPRPSDLAEWMIRLLCRIAESAELLGPETRAQMIAEIGSMLVPSNLEGLRKFAAERLGDITAALAEARKGHKDNVIQDCLAYIDEHYMQDLSLESVAAVFHFNPSYFSQYFKNKLNINFSQYLTQIRLMKAKNELEQSDDRVYQVAERLGYHDVKYFNRVFKKEFGLTPEEYRSIARRMKQAHS
ncbi:two-component system response regulator YesN [Paenibacillus phyllosphaerae]|uniref:Two-component system response regulator YesN n=1 Tax=Paenibacillus phyllosphaerae TaxID=274593 RepID=A0A7W5B4C7_9BACL|nr:response regulator [Paenibacillus phyllosphaerae]MBB3114168.1 two-component system response regulator YesN [Paenibacillus phyllosphaerae]